MKWVKKISVLVLVITMGFVCGCSKSKHEETLSTVALDRSYRNPLTGEVEDAGGEAAYATGQGMVEGATFEEALLEKTSEDHYYLTFRMGLIDFSSKYYIQYYDGKKFQDATAFVVDTGTSENGTTYTICCSVPNEKTVLRISMFVDPMGRDVIFFLRPKSIIGGNHTDFIPQYVSENAKCDVKVKDLDDLKVEKVKVQMKGNEPKGLILSTDTCMNESKQSGKIHFVIGGVLLVVIVGLIVLTGRNEGDEDEEDDE